MLGEPTKLAGAITLYFTGFGSGVSMAVIAFQRRLKRQGVSPGVWGEGRPSAGDDRGRPETP